MRDMAARAPVLAQQPQDDRDASGDRNERIDPVRQIVPTLVGRAVQPVVIGGEVELGYAARESPCAA